MPVINFSFGDLQSLVGRKLDFGTVVERLPMMGADVHHVDPASDEMAFEFFPDRPDLYCVEGVARALSAFLGISPGLRRYLVGKSDVILNVDPSVDKVRPHIWSALVTGIDMNDYLIRSVMDLQEKLHLTVGRNRKKVAIGIHDFDAVKPPFLYTTAAPTEAKFLPLQGSREMTLKEILEEHEKGKAYASVLEGKERYPMIYDKDGSVLSFPPIINGISTTVTEKTKNIFVDCTGTDLNALRACVNILVTAFADRGAKIQTVEIHRGEEILHAPNLEPSLMDVQLEEVRRLTGIKEMPDAICNCLSKMGYDSTPEGESIKVMVPAYRYDILHQADIIEDVAKGFGYEKFGKPMPRDATIGRSDDELDLRNVLRGAMTGLGYLEVSTLTLTSSDDQFIRMGRKQPDDLVEVKNPHTEDRTILRVQLLPELMAILRKNRHRDLPQRIFEVGDVVKGMNNAGRIAGASIHAKASFTEMKSTVEAILRMMGLKLDIVPTDDPSFIKGRCASVMLSGTSAGLFGELKPEVITAFELGYPVAAFELEVESVAKNSSASWNK